MTTNKFSYTLADVQVLSTIMLHVHDAPIIYAHVITYSRKQGWVMLQNKQH